MGLYRKKPVIIEAHRWWKNGDHPDDGEDFGEGRVVRYFRNPEINGTDKCPECPEVFHGHGWIDTLEGGHRVCPGDWIITGIKGERYPCKDDVFVQTYEPVESDEGVKEECL